MAYLARWPEWLHACKLNYCWMTTETLTGSTRTDSSLQSRLFHYCDSLQSSCTLPSRHTCSSHWFLVLLFFLLSLVFIYLFSLSDPPPVSTLLWTSNYDQVITAWFRSARASDSYSNHILVCLRSRCSAKCCFQKFLGPPPNLISQT